MLLSFDACIVLYRTEYDMTALVFATKIALKVTSKFYSPCLYCNIVINRR